MEAIAVPRYTRIKISFAASALALILTIPALAETPGSEGPDLFPSTMMDGSPSTLMTGLPARMQLALLNDTGGPSQRHVEPRMSESDATLRVPSELRLLVFSPHPDDETLGVAGLVQRVIRRGGSARIVWMTNGDGYTDAVRAAFDIAAPTSRDFIQFGKIRQQEALKAISQWGVEEGDAVFLGFPDGGLNHLWTAHWSATHPYKSPHTRTDRPAYPNSYMSALCYCGTSLVDEIMGVMRDFSPDWVVLPDPRDNHPDHAATGAFVLEALRKLREAGEPPFVETQAYTYLVHYPMYPHSQGWLNSINRPAPDSMTAGGDSLAETQWVSLPIDSEELEGKRRAIDCHETQKEFLHWFFKLFLMRYEMFGHLQPEQIMEVPLEYATRVRKPKS
jgi:LmbE family N-acetylglucosaminyl deacetylase